MPFPPPLALPAGISAPAAAAAISIQVEALAVQQAACVQAAAADAATASLVVAAQVRARFFPSSRLDCLCLTFPARDFLLGLSLRDLFFSFGVALKVKGCEMLVETVST